MSEFPQSGDKARPPPGAGSGSGSYALARENERLRRELAEVGEDGRVATVLGIARDITEHRQVAETARRAAHDLSERLKELRCLYDVASFTHQRSRPLAEVLRGTMAALVAAYQYPEVACVRVTLDGQAYSTEPFAQTPWRQAVAFGERGTIEVFYREERPMAHEGPFLSEERAMLGTVGELFTRSLRERREWSRRERAEAALTRKTKELERMNAELEEFAYIASHDLKAPLRAVANLALVIDEDAAGHLDEQSRRHLRMLRERVRSMDALIEGLLAYARSGYSARERTAVALGPLLRQLVAELNLPPGFSVELAEPLPVLVADPLQLRQIFQNLITNAVTHHDRINGHVWVRACGGDDAWCLEVADDGPGIPEFLRTRMFRMFTTSGKAGHSGIGLAIVRKLVLANGGRIEVTDNQPRGASFRITWPR